METLAEEADKLPEPIQAVIIPDGYVPDYIDGKFRKDTPEEYVRQNIEKRLASEHKYKREQISIEFSIKIGNWQHRVDGSFHLPIIGCKQEMDRGL